MEVNPNNFVSINRVLSEVLMALDDVGAKKLNIGFYRSRVKDALDELNYEVFFLSHTEDVQITASLSLPMPEGAYNLEQAHIYKGTPEDVDYMENLYWKRGMVGNEGGYTADRVGGATPRDPFVRVTMVNKGSLYFNIQNGIIHLSSSCEGFDYVRFTYSGVPSMKLDDIAMIPPEVKKAVVLWVIEKCASYLKVREQVYRQIQVDAAVKLDEYGMNGAWHEAKMRLGKLDRKMLKDIIRYNSTMFY